eukprot:gene24600-33068_t
MFDRDECKSDLHNDSTILTAQLNEDDYRCVHIKNILKLEVDENLKCGILNVGCTDNSKLLTSESGKGISIAIGKLEELVKSGRPRVDLILAVPRPLRLERLLSMISCQGVGRIILVGANKVEKDFFGSHLFRRPKDLEHELVLGLSQAATECFLPEIMVRKNLHKFLLKEFDELYPSSYGIIAHPFPAQGNDNLTCLQGENSASASGRIFTELDSLRLSQRVVVAIGPEGGWEEEEVRQFEAKGFKRTQLGSRILRTDIAVTAALALVHDWIDSRLIRSDHK